MSMNRNVKNGKIKILQYKINTAVAQKSIGMELNLAHGVPYFIYASFKDGISMGVAASRLPGQPAVQCCYFCGYAS